MIADWGREVEKPIRLLKEFKSPSPTRKTNAKSPKMLTMFAMARECDSSRENTPLGRFPGASPSLFPRFDEHEHFNPQSRPPKTTETQHNYEEYKE